MILGRIFVPIAIVASLFLIEDKPPGVAILLTMTMLLFLKLDDIHRLLKKQKKD